MQIKSSRQALQIQNRKGRKGGTKVRKLTMHPVFALIAFVAPLLFNCKGRKVEAAVFVFLAQTFPLFAVKYKKAKI